MTGSRTAARVAIYVNGRYAKETYKVESYDVRLFRGVELLKLVLEDAGIPVDYASAATVGEFDVLLVSITAAADWYAYIAERAKWPSTAAKVIVGGAGVLNIRPVLDHFDIAFFGRAEREIVPLVEATLANERYESPSVAYASTFDPDRDYYIAQAESVFDRPVGIASSKRPAFTERAIGCRRKCLFCGYTWHRKPILAPGGEDGQYIGDAGAESTIFDMRFERPVTRTIGIDGMSERLRYAVNKPISDQLIYDSLLRLADPSTPYPWRLKLFMVVGYPTETLDDWKAFRDVLDAVDADAAPGKGIGLELVATPFKAMPATPLAGAPVARRNFRFEISKRLKRGERGSRFFAGRRFWAIQTMGTESLATVILEMLLYRGVEGDAELVSKLARSRAFMTGTSARRLATLEANLDISRILGELQWENLPTRYLKSYAQDDALKAAAAKYRKRLGEPDPRPSLTRRPSMPNP